MGKLMESKSEIIIKSPGGERLNGLGMILKQYLDQNFSEFEKKTKQALRIRCCVAVEVEKGIASTISFQGDTILIENGVSGRPDLYLQSSYVFLAKVLSGQVNPLMEIIRRKVKLKAFPRRPIQSIKMLNLLKIPPELMVEQPAPSQWKKSVPWAVGLAMGVLGLYLWIRYQ